MSPATSRPRKTVEDYLALPDDVRAELIDGELYVTPSPEADHQHVVLELAVALRTYARDGNRGEVFVAPLDVHLPSGSVVQPDVLFVSRERLGIRRLYIHGPPDLAVEVVSPTHPERDRALKRRLYAKDGVREYWIVDPGERSVEVLRLEGDVYEPAGYATGASVLATPLFPDLALDLSSIWPKG